MSTTPENRRKDSATQMLNNLPLQDREALLLEFADRFSLPPATIRTLKDFSWSVVVVGFLLILIGSFVAFISSIVLFSRGQEDLLTIFTTLAGYIAGLLTPNHADKQITFAHSDQIDITRDALSALNRDELLDLFMEFNLRPPIETSKEKASALVVLVFMFLLIASFIALTTVELILSKQSSGLLTVFTTIAGYLAGLLTPSPLQNKA